MVRDGAKFDHIMNTGVGFTALSDCAAYVREVIEVLHCSAGEAFVFVFVVTHVTPPIPTPVLRTLLFVWDVAWCCARRVAFVARCRVVGLKKDNQTLQSENQMLKGHIAEHANQQLVLQNKMQKILFCM